MVLDTNVLVAALRSRTGASYRLLNMLGSGEISIYLSVPLVLEYEDVLKRPGVVPAVTTADIDHLLDYLCLVGNQQLIHYLWRPVLLDPQDDLVLELAVAAQCVIITHNIRHFAGCDQLGVPVMRPAEWLTSVGSTL